jgi:hypothetical protein
MKVIKPNVEQVKDLQFWRENAEEDYLKVPIEIGISLNFETELENSSIEDMRYVRQVLGLWGLGEVSNQTENNERFQA